MSILSGQFKVVLEEVGQQRVLINQLIKDRIEKEDFAGLFPISSRENLIALDKAIELGNKKSYVSIDEQFPIFSFFLI